MPAECLSAEQRAAYASFIEVPSLSDLEQFFLLDSFDRNVIAQSRADSHRLGVAVQIGTVRYKGLFLEDPLAVPWPVVDYLAEQLGIADASQVKKYAERPKTTYEHAWMIRDAYGYHTFDDTDSWSGRQLTRQFRTFLHGRAWTHAEGPVALFEQSVAWLRRHRVLLPGVTVLERLVGSVRERADVRMYTVVAKQVRRADAGLPGALSGLLVVPEGSRVSELEKLRQAPKRTSGTEMVRALQRVDNLAGFGLGRVNVSKVPVRRMKTLAKYGAGSKAPALDRLVEPRRTATLLAVTRSLEAEAIDDALDPFALLMATRLISPARRKSADERLRMLPRLERASKLVAKAGRVLVDQLDLVDQEDADLDVAAMWAAVADIASVSKEQVRAALDVVEELVPEEDGAAEAAMRAALVEKYNTVRPFLRLLGESKALAAAPGGRRVLAAVRRLPELSRRQVSKKPLLPEEIDAALVTASWKRAVYGNPDLPQGAVDRDAYVVCVLEHLMRALTVRDVFASPSLRWTDPRAHLLAGAQWEAIAEDVLASLSLTDPVQQLLSGKVLALDAAWRQMAARLEEAGEDALVSVVTPAGGGRARLSGEKLGALGESESLAWLRAACQAMLPRIDLPELLLEVHAWTGFLDAYVHLADISTRMNDLPRSLVALLISEACNVGLTPVIKAGDEALTRGRLSHVDQNYVRGETHAAANAILIEHQGRVPIVASWGGGLLASVDGLRFVVPVKTINAGPSPKYYGYKRGITWLNAVNDQVAGIGQMVVSGTPRDSLYILDCLINLDAGPKLEVVTTDQASDSDMVFGSFSMLGYRFAPRFADLGDQRFWRAALPDGTTGDYGVLEAIARNKVNTKKVITQWPDMLRVAGSLVTNQVRAYDLLRMFARQGNPTPPGQAFAEYGRIDKTMHLLSMLDPIDSSYRRSLGKQLSVQESRHRLARKICHGNAGRIRQAYREGQEDQLAALGLVLNAVVLWNSKYLSAIVDRLRAQGVPVKDEDVARLSPLGHAHLNCLGRYAIASSAPDKGLRPLQAAALPQDATSRVIVDEDGV
ncbi:Tn3 family transposase [Nonomuraea diastatica]|uniref:Tn3 family transposase n=1 Tax=Nonomuraea diastatica TaxID=1848329 RepID=A0A4R4X3H9_9ACTN|nr:Tn3 family transposase [Nonomuraea diastatica]TDD24792.1 Tn3 family transposase [Nonomuraea diastatica]